MIRYILAGLSLLATLSVAPAFAGEADTPNIGMESTHVGHLYVAAVHDNHYTMPNDGKVFGGGAGPAAVADILKANGAPSDSITVQFSGLLVRDGKRIVLIDTGAGPGMKAGLIESLKLAGVSPDQVTDVLITHAHFDHIGGLVTAEGKRAFPNAMVRLTTREWVYLQGRDEAKSIAAAIAGQVKTFEPGAQITTHIKAVPVVGHTPGHTAYEISDGQDRLLDVGDSVHSSILSLAHPEWIMGFDGDQALAAQSRVELAKKLAASHELIFAPHFPFPGLGRIKAAGTGYIWEPALKP